MNKSKLRQELDRTRNLVLFLFENSCIICGRFTKEVHEITPISHGKKALAVKNRVPLCSEHHDWAHRVGTRNSIPILQEKRAEYLRRKWQMKKK